MKFLPLFILFLFSSPIWAQKSTLTATIINQDKEPLIGSTIVLINSQDKLEKATTSNEEGFFIMKKLPNGDYTIRITYIGFKDYEKAISINQKKINLGEIILEQGIDLDEIEIVEKIPPVLLKGDTIEYNADSFETLPNADAIELIKLLPGVQVDEEGVIKVNGESVTEILVDGQPFFDLSGGELLETLPAEVLKKIQVYEYTSEEARFLGLDEDNESKTINLVFKPDKKIGFFGTALAGYGLPNLYNAGLSTSILNKKQQYSFSGKTDNVNDSGLGVSGGFAPTFGGNRTISGINSKNAINARMKDDWGENIDFSTSYAFTNSKTGFSKDVLTTYIGNNNTQELFEEQLLRQRKKINQKFVNSLSWKIDTLSKLKTDIRFSTGNSETNSNSYSQTSEIDNIINQTDKFNQSTGKNFSFSNSFRYWRKLRKPKQTLSINIAPKIRNDNIEKILISNSEFQDSIMTQQELINQASFSKDNSWSISSKINYSMPIKEHGSLKFFYDNSTKQKDTRKETFDFDESNEAYTLPVDILSNILDNNKFSQRLGSTFMVNLDDNYSYSLSASLKNNKQKSTQLIPFEDIINQNIWNFVPRVSFSKTMEKIGEFRTNYSFTTRQPLLSQLQNLLDNENPLRLRIGNPNLKPSIRHFFDVTYSKSTSKDAGYSSFRVGFSAVISQNAITSSRYLQETDNPIFQNIDLLPGSQLHTPINTNGNWYSNGNISYSTSLQNYKANFTAELNTLYSQKPDFLNDIINYKKDNTTSLNLSYSATGLKFLRYNLSANSSLTTAVNSLTDANNTQYLRHTSNLSTTWIIWESLYIKSIWRYQLYYGINDDFQEKFLVWDIDISKTIFKNKKGKLSFKANDILNQNQVIDRRVNSQGVVNTNTNTLTRFFFLKFTYKFRKFAGG